MLDPTDTQFAFDFNAQDTEEDVAKKRDELARRVSAFELNTIEHKVAWVLNVFPSARDNDTDLLIHYCKSFHSEIAGSGMIALQDLKELPALWTLSRSRRTIQNKYGLYKATEEVQRLRGVLKDETTEKHAGERPIHPAIHVFADEGGKTQQHLVVGSMWILAPVNMPRLQLEIQAFRNSRLRGSEMHFKRVSKGNIDRYKQFVDQFVKDDPFMGFKALVWKNKGLADIPLALADMFYYVLRGGVEHAHATKRASLPRAIHFTKDKEEEGYDKRVLSAIREKLTAASHSVFNSQLTVGTLGAEPSEDSPFVQIADLFTASVSRVKNESGNHAKDEFARYFLEAVGDSVYVSDSDRSVILDSVE
ncbi:MAG: hypothetical protein Rubg2KO_16790 [Rubricoccaceae bacterium]